MTVIELNLSTYLAANCWCGGPATESLVDTILNDVRVQLRTAADLDAVLFSMHGAMASKDTRDVEGAIAALIRSEIGPEIPLVLTLDHHANVTTNIVESCDILTAYRHCPHTDMFETGRRGASLMLRLLRGEISPATAFCKLPLVTPCERFMTADGPMATWFELARDAAENSEIVDVSLFPVQPWLDVPDFGWSVVVTSNNDPGLAETICAELAQAAWDQRDEFFVEKLTPTDAVRRAAAAANGPVVIADGADATNGGSPGDSTCLLREMLAQDVTCPTYLTLVDPAAVAAATEVGAGGRIEMPIGATWSTAYHRPVLVDAEVVRFSDGTFSVGGHCAAHVDMGRCALLRAGSIHIVVSEHAGPGHNPAVFRQIGLEPRDAQIVVVKCTVGHMDVFADIMTESLPCECPGPSPSYVDRLTYTHVPRPLYPLDSNMTWEATTCLKTQSQ